MVVPEVLLSSYTYARCKVYNYNNAVVLKSVDFLGDPVDYVFAKEQTEDYTIKYNLVGDKSKKFYQTDALYANSKDYAIKAVHLDMWIGV